MSLKKLYIDKQVVDFSEVQLVKKYLQDIPCEYIDNVNDIFQKISESKDSVQTGKELLFLTKNRGAFVKKCPGTTNYTCCDYTILHIGTFCTMDCSYCILQAYFHPPVLQYFVNHDDMFKELEKVFLQNKIFRIGTGEFTDSMIWERYTDLSKKLISKFANQDNCILELKTKCVDIKKLQGLSHNQKIILAWSLNTEKIMQSDERKTASLESRLKAASQCESWGYKLAFHFDPIIIYEGCEDEYKKVIKKLFSSVSYKNIVWISIGSFRFIPTLKPIIQERFPKSKIVYGEFITGLDGKMRYFKPLRIKLYREIVSYIKEIAPDVIVYFCMEDDEIWEKVMGFVPDDKGGLGKILDQSAAMHCNLNKQLL